MKVLSYLSGDYCKDILIAMSLAALFVGIKHYGQRELRVFTYYILFSLVQDLTDLYRVLEGVNKPIPEMVQGWLSNLFTLFEFVVFNYFILSHVTGRKRRSAIRIVAGIFLLLFFESIIVHHSYLVDYRVFYLSESVFLTIPCLIYFYELFVDIRNYPLKDRSAFWIITGTLFVNCCGIPIYLMWRYLDRYAGSALDLNYLLYTLFFVLLIKAYRCKPEARMAVAPYPR